MAADVSLLQKRSTRGKRRGQAGEKVGGKKEYSQATHSGTFAAHDPLWDPPTCTIGMWGRGREKIERQKTRKNT